MSVLRAHIAKRAAELADLASIELEEDGGTVTVRLRPRSPGAVGVVLSEFADAYGWVALDDPAGVPAELDGDVSEGIDTIDHFLALAVEGRATAYHLGGGGCVEETREDGTIFRSWMSAFPWPGWRRRANRVAYQPWS